MPLHVCEAKKKPASDRVKPSEYFLQKCSGNANYNTMSKISNKEVVNTPYNFKLLDQFLPKVIVSWSLWLKLLPKGYEGSSLILSGRNYFRMYFKVWKSCLTLNDFKARSKGAPESFIRMYELYQNGGGDQIAYNVKYGTDRQ